MQFPFMIYGMALYTGWPRKNATTLIVNFKDIVKKKKLLGRKFIFEQNDTVNGPHDHYFG